MDLPSISRATYLLLLLLSITKLMMAAGAEYFSKFDLIYRYWQLEKNPDSRKCQCFTSRNDIFLATEVLRRNLNGNALSRSTITLEMPNPFREWTRLCADVMAIPARAADGLLKKVDNCWSCVTNVVTASTLASVAYSIAVQYSVADIFLSTTPRSNQKLLRGLRTGITRDLGGTSTVCTCKAAAEKRYSLARENYPNIVGRVRSSPQQSRCAHETCTSQNFVDWCELACKGSSNFRVPQRHARRVRKHGSSRP